MARKLCPYCQLRKIDPRWQQCRVCKWVRQRKPRAKCARPGCSKRCKSLKTRHCSKSCATRMRTDFAESRARGIVAGRKKQRANYLRRVAARITDHLSAALAALPARVTPAEREAVRAAFLSGGARIYSRAYDVGYRACRQRYLRGVA